MPSYSETQIEYHKSLIRKVMVVSGHGFVNHGREVSLRSIKQQLDENGICLDLAYIAKLKNKILWERTKYVNKQTAHALVHELEHAFSVNLKELYRIVFSKQSASMQKIAAMREIRETYLTIYDKKMALAELTEKPAGPVGNPAYVVPDEKLKSIVDSMIRFGLLPESSRETIKKMTPVA